MSSTSEEAGKPAHKRNLVDRRLVEDTGALLDGLVAGSGNAFLEWLVSFLADRIGCDYALVGELRGEDWDRVRTLAVVARGTLQPAIEYDLRGTPCADVVAQGTCSYPEGVASRFPEDRLLAEMRVDSYVGVPLMNPSGLPLGLLVLLHSGPMEPEKEALARDALERFRLRTESELQRRRAVRELQAIIEVSERPDTRDCVEALTTALAHVMHVRVAFVSVFLDAERTRMRTVAMSIDGELRDPVTYDILGTPCEEVHARKSGVFIPSGITELFPDDQFLEDLDAEGYLARPLVGFDGETLGHVGVIHDRALQSRFNSQQSLFRIFATRIGAEVFRQQAEARQLALERSLRDGQKMESLGVLAGGIAHDFNNILASILGHADIALEHTSTPTGRESVEEVIRASRRGADLCRQMLAYAGQGIAATEPLDLSVLVHDMIELLAASVSKKCEIRRRLSQDLPAVQGDVVQLQQVIMNLFTNASDALQDARGVVTATTEVRRLSAADLGGMTLGEGRPAGPYVVLEVVDDGCGMDAATAARMFDPFFTTKFTGRGLGLAAMLGIVREHQGAISVRSAKNEGTTVTLCFPSLEIPVRSPAPTTQPSPAPMSAHGTILVVDDEPAVRKVYERFLERDGFEVLTAADGVEAVEMFRAHKDEIRLVVLDLTLPRMDGGEALRALRGIKPDTRVILASGYHEDEINKRLGSTPPDGVLAKPFDSSALRQAVRRVLADDPDDVELGEGVPPS